MDEVAHSQNRATSTVTEMNVGLRSAGNGRLARHGGPGQGSPYLRTADRNKGQCIREML